MSRRPFYGQTPAPPIARMDMQSATAPGRSFANAFNQLGIAIGGAIAKNAENKEKKENQQLAENAFISAGMQPEQAKIASRDPQVGKMLQQFMQMDETRRVNDAQLAQGDRQIDIQGRQVGVQEDQLGFNIDKYNQGQQKEQELEDELEAGNRLMISPTERKPTRSEGGRRVQEALMKGEPLPPPAKMIQEDSPVVQELPDRFKGFGRNVQEAVKEGKISPRVGMSMINEKKAIAQEQASREAEFDEKVSLELFKHELKNQNKATQDSTKGVVVNNSVDRAFGQISPFSTGLGSYLKNVPMTEALALNNTLATIKANIGFDKLQAMREASPTGGALGAVSNLELESLQSVFGSLNQAQSDTDLKYNLGLLRFVYNDIIHGAGNHNYLHPDDPDYTEILKTPSTSQSTGDPNQEASPELLTRLKELEEMERKRNLGFESEMGN